MSKARPKEEWQRVEVPKLRIVSGELWSAVETRITHQNKRIGSAQLGGMNRTAGSRSYLFSGLLVCGACKSRLVIVSGPGGEGMFATVVQVTATAAFATTESRSGRIGGRSNFSAHWNSGSRIRR